MRAVTTERMSRPREKERKRARGVKERMSWMARNDWIAKRFVSLLA